MIFPSCIKPIFYAILSLVNFSEYLNNKYVLPVSIALVILVLVLVGGGYFLYQKTRPQPVSLDPQAAQRLAQEEVKKLVQEVSKLIDLPQGEDPTVATVTDITRLRDQPFFARAKNGDKVLIYTQARKAILYNPTAKKIIDVAPINIGSPSAQEAFKIVLRNGTTITGLTSRAESDVKKSLPNAQIIGKENAAKSDYQYSLVVVLNDGIRDLAVKLAKDLEASLSALPKEETRPKEGDILVILGKDRI